MNVQQALAILSLPEDFTPEQLKRNYRKLSKIYHPDIVGNEKGKYFLEIKDAYECLQAYLERAPILAFTHVSIFNVRQQ